VTRILTLVFALLLSAAWLQAQQYPQTGSSQSGSSTSEQASTRVLARVKRQFHAYR